MVLQLMVMLFVWESFQQIVSFHQLMPTLGDLYVLENHLLEAAWLCLTCEDMRICEEKHGASIEQTSVHVAALNPHDTQQSHPILPTSVLWERNLMQE